MWIIGRKQGHMYAINVDRILSISVAPDGNGLFTLDCTYSMTETKTGSVEVMAASILEGVAEDKAEVTLAEILRHIEMGANYTMPGIVNETTPGPGLRH